ncbi:MAG: SRPBCC family protein [Gammaproteobacteria bacterium]|nr:SRPBCC family protein [Gammaproteobacteria bacterium]
MKGLKITVVTVIVLLVGVYAAGYFLPSKYQVERQIEIAAPASAVMPLVNNFERWSEWGVWFQRDPNMQLSYQGTAATVGHQSQWTSESQGSGTMILTQVDEARIQYDLIFPEMEMQSVGEVILTQKTTANNQTVTLVTWRDQGDVKDDIVGRYFVLFIDQLMGPDFEQGLENLKQRVES